MSDKTTAVTAAGTQQEHEGGDSEGNQGRLGHRSSEGQRRGDASR